MDIVWVFDKRPSATPVSTKLFSSIIKGSFRLMAPKIASSGMSMHSIDEPSDKVYSGESRPRSNKSAYFMFSDLRPSYLRFYFSFLWSTKLRGSYFSYRKSWGVTSSTTSASVINPSEDEISITELSLSIFYPLLPNLWGSVRIKLKLAMLISSLVPPGPSILYLDWRVNVCGTSLPCWVPLA